MPAPLYDLLLVLHVAVAFLGFGSIAMGGWAASAGRRSEQAVSEERVVRFFREGVDWPGRLIFIVPVLGLALLFGGDRPDVSRAWPWLGLAIWVVAAGIASGMGWPAERRAQAELAAARAGDAARLPAFVSACARMERAAALTSICFVLAVTLMIWQP
jgi:hypothetical protein